MKKYFITICLLATIATLAGCMKDSNGLVTLNAELESVGNSKVHMNGVKPTWDDGDAVWVNNNQESVTVSGTSASINIPDGHSTTSYLAIYPYSSVKSADGSSVTISIPTTQDWAEDASHNQKINMPMAASTTDGTLKFHNLCSLMKVTVQNNTGAEMTLYSVTLKANASNVYLSGSAAINKSDIGPTLTPALTFTSGSNMITLRGINATIAASGSKDVYLVVPTFTTTTTMDIEIYTSNGVQSRTGGSGADMPRNILATATYQPTSSWSWEGSTNGHNWRILWPGGPKWATRNVGATADDGNGLYFAWGTTTGYASSVATAQFVPGNYPSTFGTPSATNPHNWNTATELPYDPVTYVLKPEYDAARANWGGSWRMPTKEEITTLVNYRGSGSDIRTFTCNGRSITLPAAGFYRNGYFNDSHDYWSSTRNHDVSSGRSGNIYDIWIPSSGAELGNNASPWIGEPIRAVCD